MQKITQKIDFSCITKANEFVLLFQQLKENQAWYTRT